MGLIIALWLSSVQNPCWLVDDEFGDYATLHILGIKDP